ncbi:hypothetical protein ABH922_003314 [Rhodococcus sp. 27YEA15]|uniref:hypothetical protein n=1 Tax=Rhodococcus sp. 27YEA15 TaxID=3156259 RepID=UPI003C7C8285
MTTSRWQPIVLLTVVGSVCGLVAVGVFRWWWNSLESPYILIGGEYVDHSDPTFTGAAFMDLFPAEPPPWLYSSLVLGPTAVGLVAGVALVVFGGRLRSRSS